MTTTLQPIQLGRTGVPVTALGIGLAALGRPAYINLGRERDLPGGRDPAALQAATFAVLDAAWAAGIRYVDVARSYGRAEEFLAAWLESRDIRPEELTVGTKWGYTYVGGWHVDAEVHEIKDHSLAALRRQVAESSGLLGEHLALLQVHSATLDSGVLTDAGVLDELVRLRHEGAVRAIGLSVSGAHQAEAVRVAMGVERAGVAVFDTVQATFNLLERSAGPALAAAHARGMGILVKEALANGRLVRGEEAKALRPVAERLGIGPDAVALAFVLEQPWAGVTLLGAATTAQLGENLAATRTTLDDEAHATLDAIGEPAAEYWERRSRLPWV